MALDDEIKRVREVLEQADSVVALTGAGVSAESGVPTFRGEEGLWKNFRAEELATPEAFERNPELVWEWYAWRRELIAKVECNPAHHALAAMERQQRNFTLVTQNVDGLHRRAGSTRVLEIHGNIWMVRCTRCGKVTENLEVPLPLPPLCKDCGALLRPHIVWFGEMLPRDILEEAIGRLQHCKVMLAIGTSSVVQPAASFVLHAKQSGAFTVEINLATTPNSQFADAMLIGKAAEILPRLT